MGEDPAESAPSSPSSPALLGAQERGAHAVTSSAARGAEKRRTPLIAGLGLSLVVLFGVAGLVIARRAPEAPVVAAPPPPRDVPAAPSALVPAPAVLPPTVALAPSPEASSPTAPATASVHAGPPKPRPPLGLPHAPPLIPTPAKSPPQSKDVFDDRKD